MSFLRQFVILALIPLTVWGAMPHVACRCSNGQVRFTCPKLGQQANIAESNVCATPTSKSCCGTGRQCCGSSKESKQSSCCAEGCRCTPVVLESSQSQALKKVNLPDVVMIAFVPVTHGDVWLPRLTPSDLPVVDGRERVPDDLIVLCERWLI